MKTIIIALAACVAMSACVSNSQPLDSQDSSAAYNADGSVSSDTCYDIDGDTTTPRFAKAIIAPSRILLIDPLQSQAAHRQRHT